MVTEVVDVFKVSDGDDRYTVNDAPDIVTVIDDAPEGVVVVTDTIDHYEVLDSVDKTTVVEQIDQYEVVDQPVINQITVVRPVALARLTATTGEDIGIYKMVYMDNGLVYLADHLDPTHSGSVLGIAEEAIPTGFPVSIVLAGEITNAGWNFNVGDPCYLSVGGLVTQTIPTSGFLLKVGVATALDTLVIDLKMPIHLH